MKLYIICAYRLRAANFEHSAWASACPVHSSRLVDFLPWKFTNLECCTTQHSEHRGSLGDSGRSARDAAKSKTSVNPLYKYLLPEGLSPTSYAKGSRVVIPQANEKYSISTFLTHVLIPQLTERQSDSYDYETTFEIIQLQNIVSFFREFVKLCIIKST